MAEKLKNYLGVAIIIAILVVAGAIWRYASYYGESIEPSSFRSFAVTAEGNAIAIPDVAQFSLSVITEGGSDIGSLQKENTEKVNKIIEFIKSNGIDAKDIKTTSYNLTPRYETCVSPRPLSDGRSVCPPPKIVGYTINQSVQVKIRNFSKIGSVLGGVVESGANSVSQLQFTIDDPTKVQNEAREEAIEKAKEKAKAIARAGGFGLGRLLSIEEGGYAPTPYYARSLAFTGAAEEKALPTIEPGSEEVTVNVTLRYEIK